MLIANKHIVPAHGAEGDGRHASRCRCWKRWCRRGRSPRKGARRSEPEAALRRPRDGARHRRQHTDRRAEASLVASRDRQRLRSEPERAEPARAFPRLPHHRQQHRRSQRRGVHRTGNRRRPFPLERGVPHPVALQADAGLRSARRRLDRPDLRQEARPGHADPVDAVVHRERRSVGRLLVRLLLRLHRFDQLVVAGDSRCR